MATVDTLNDFSPRSLGELKAWLEPWFLGRETPAEPAAAVTSSGGIDFNKTNSTDATGANADYLYTSLTGSTPYNDGSYDYAYLFLNNGVPGAIAFTQDGDGAMWLANEGAGAPSPFSGSKDYGGSSHDSYPTATRSDGIVLNNDGDGIMLLRNTASTTVIDNAFGGVVLDSTGSDFNSVAIKCLVSDWDFLIAKAQTVTRNAGTHHITAITMTNEALRVRCGSTNHVWLYNLPTSSSGLTTGEVWNSSGVLHVV